VKAWRRQSAALIGPRDPGVWCSASRWIAWRRIIVWGDGGGGPPLEIATNGCDSSRKAERPPRLIGAKALADGCPRRRL